MCGIVAAVECASPELVAGMAATLAHRGPDGTGLWWQRPPAGPMVALAQARLAVVDRGERSAGPLGSEDRRLQLAFNGEVYNHRELRAALGRGHRWRGGSDAEVVLHLYEECGEEAFGELRGMFALALWDGLRRRLLLARDRVGLKPLFYARPGGAGLAAASELKALLVLPGLDRGWSPRALDAYLAYLYIPAPLTIYAGIKELAPGELVSWEAGQVERRRYWRLRVARRSRPRSPRDAAAAVRTVLAESVRLRLAADVPVGIFLSGGVDSTALAALAAAAGQRPPAFTLALGGPGAADLAAARAVTSSLGLPHRVVPPPPDWGALLDRVVEGFDEPYGNPTAGLLWTLAARARDEVTVVLAGDGGDELFGGYPRYRGAELARLYRCLPRAVGERLAPALARRLGEREDRPWRRRLREFTAAASLPVPAMYASWVGYFSAAERAALYTPEVAEAVERCGGPAEGWFIERLFAAAMGAGAPSPEDALLYVDARSFLPGNLLAAADRMGMARGMEVRCPFTDHRLLELVAAMPRQWRLGKRLLGSALADVLPRNAAGRAKVGFNPPIGMLLRTSLAPLAAELLGKERLERRGLFQPAALQSLLAAHRSGRRDLGHHLWALMVLERWFELYADRPRRAAVVGAGERVRALAAQPPSAGVA